MRTAAPPLLPIFRSALQGWLLAATLLHPEREQSLSQLAGHVGAPVATVQREVERLARAGILRTRRTGNARLVSANTSSLSYEPLKQLVLHAFGPLQVLGEELAAIEQIEESFIFGSWAARYHGIPGPEPADVDVLIVGNPDRDEAYEAALRAERRLGRPVNVIIRSPSRWRNDADGFVKQVRSSPLVAVPRHHGSEGSSE